MNDIDKSLPGIYDLKKVREDMYITRKSRINAASRLLGTERFIQGINIYYSCFSAILSIISLESGRQDYSLLSVIFTVVLTISIVYLNAQRFGDRANDLKTNYIAMLGLLYDISKIDEHDVEKFADIQKRYIDLLTNCENHSNIDYITSKKYINQITKKECVMYYSYKTFRYIIYTIAIIAPILLLLLFYTLPIILIW